MVLLDARDLHLVSTSDRYGARHQMHLRRLGRQAFEHRGRVRGYINHSRALVDCPNCNNSCALWLQPSEIVEARCFSCGAVFRELEFPMGDALNAILDVLALRPNMANRNWVPGEHFYELVRQNVENGDAVPEELL